MITREYVSMASAESPVSPLVGRASSEEIQKDTAPTVDDLANSLLFSPHDGRIWLNDQRMLLMHSSSLGILRRELVNAMGLQGARSLLKRVGFSSGTRDAELIRRQWPDSELADAFNAGPRLHSLEGVVKVTPVRFEFDVDRGTFYGEFLWHDSSEAAECIKSEGVVSHPACWMQLGYASGYATAFTGRRVIYKEVECMAMGAPHCRIIGRPAAEWEEGEVELDAHELDVHEEASPRARSRGQGLPLHALTVVGEADNHDPEPESMVGRSASFLAAKHLLELVAVTDATVLFTGESGVGKERFSRALHERSLRREGPFVAVNCAAIPEALVEAELFGVDRGAFTGAVATRPGKFERASGGTLLLDEVGCLTPIAQSKLLRVLQEGEIERVGGTQTIKVDVRVIGATNVSLRKEVEQGRFREDLFFRLNVFPVELPPLRQRRDDIPLLLAHFLRLFRARHRRVIPGFTRRAAEALLSYEYPGNIRELQNLIERGVICAADGKPLDTTHIFRQGELISSAALSVGLNGTLQGRGSPLGNSAGNAVDAIRGSELIDHVLQHGVSLGDVENWLCERALERSGGNVAAAARALGLSRAQLDYRLAKLREQLGM
jgi:two-component system, NtrC family, response regulator HydG